MKVCLNCNHQMPDEAKRCGNCGTLVNSDATGTSNKFKTAEDLNIKGGRKPKEHEYYEKKKMCPKCHKELSDGMRFCGDCGTPVVEEPEVPAEIFCIHCGQKSSSKASFCPNCGESLSVTPVNGKEKKAAKPSKEKKQRIKIVRPKIKKQLPKVEFTKFKKFLSKKAILFGAIGVAVVAVLVVAISLIPGWNGKNEKDLLADLIAYPGFYMVEGSEVSEFSIIKRMTDEDNRTDKVYVSVNIDQEAATETRAYIMNYTAYNEGWLLDDIEGYFGNEVEWKIVPKGPPTNERIMEELISCSDMRVASNYEDGFGNEILKQTYFFEEGKYYTEIYSGDIISDTEYSCFVTTYRNFEYMAVREEQKLYFMFDENTYEWYLYDDEIISLQGDYYYDGAWEIPTSGANIQFAMSGVPEEIGALATHYAACIINGKAIDASFWQSIPSTDAIDITLCSFGDVLDIYWGGVCYGVQISPDMVWCYDYEYEYGFELEPGTLHVTPPALKTTGFVDMGTKHE